MGDGDERALGWFKENCSPFDEKYGMVPMNFAALGLNGEQRALFKMKMSEIVKAIERIRAAAADREMARRR